MSIYEFENKRPEIGEGSFIHPQAAIIGSVVVGRDCYIGPGAVLRGDFGSIFIGDGSNVQENAVLHASPSAPVTVEKDCIIAHGALLHDCLVKEGAMVGMGAVVLHNAVIGKDSMVAGGAVVGSGYEVPERKIVGGNPAKVLKDISDQLHELLRLGLAAYQELPGRYLNSFKKIG